MSNNVNLHISQHSLKESILNGRFVAPLSFELDKWVHHTVDAKGEVSGEPVLMLQNTKLYVQRFDLPVCLRMVDRLETHTPGELADYPSVLTFAGPLSKLTFHEETWHYTRIFHSRGVSAYLRELPVDWPVFVVIL
jgi:hypothetical protein